MNIETAIKKGVNILKENNITNPYLDSEVLMTSTVKKDKKYIILNSKKTLTDKDLSYFNELIKRRTKGEPIAYLINKKEFWNTEFYINNDVLIPRPDTELIIEQVLKIYSKNSYCRTLDIGLGSGCILLSILKERKNFYGVGIDVSKKSIKVSKFNAKMLNLYSRVKFYNSNVDNFNIGKYDLIVSNPPYIELSTLKYLEKDVFNFEPKLALNGGKSGVSEIKKVIDKSSSLIKNKGKFILEIGFNQKNKVKEMLKRKGFYINSILKDYAKNDRCIISTKI